MKYTYGIFIIESLRSDDYFDGELLKEILELSKIEVKYEWVGTKKELKIKLEEFERSNFRYLHISCHANYDGIELTNESLSNKELGDLLKGKIKDKRIFLSDCKGGNRNLASRIIRNGAYSLIGSPIDLHFDKAALFWASFFHVINEFDEKRMKKAEIRFVIRSFVELFYIPMNYYTFIKKERDTRMRRLKIRPGLGINSKKINI